jgi:hypothetical protein
MKRATLTGALVAGLVLAASVHAADTAACGEGYPKEFPCLDGGVIGQVPKLPPIPGLKTMTLVAYPTTAASLVAKLTQVAQSDGWQVETQVGHEPQGDRHRMRISRADRTVSASIYDENGRAVLQIMEFEPRH